MALIPDRAGYRPGDPVTIELDPPAAEAGTLVVTRLAERVREIAVEAGAVRVQIGDLVPGGYGITLGARRTAIDVLRSAFDRPRYGFVAELTDRADLPAVMRTFRRLHLTAAQFYDWAYRHSTLLPPEDRYLDPLGQERSLAVVDAMASAFASQGTVPLGYSAVYAIAHDEAPAWDSSIIRRPDGEPYRLGDAFLVLVDPADPRWLEHYLGQLESVMERTAFAGFHLDQYGWPKFAMTADGRTVDLAVSFVTLLEGIRERLPDVRMIFNNVNDFPTYATAGAPQDATYIEVWPPHTTLGDLGRLAADARRANPQHPPILSAYLSCFAQDEHRALAAAELVMATAFSHGASHLLLGEHGRVLTGPYYPDNHVLAEQSLDRFVPWYDHAVRYGDLLYGADHVDVTEHFLGGINGDLIIEVPDRRVSPHAEPGCVWARAVRTPQGIVVHLIDLSAQEEIEWDAGKNDSPTVDGATLAVSFAGVDDVVYATSVDDPDLRAVTADGTSGREQGDALSAAQTSARFPLPAFRVWSMVLIPLP